MTESLEGNFEVDGDFSLAPEENSSDEDLTEFPTEELSGSGDKKGGKKRKRSATQNTQGLNEEQLLRNEKRRAKFQALKEKKKKFEKTPTNSLGSASHPAKGRHAGDFRVMDSSSQARHFWNLYSTTCSQFGATLSPLEEDAKIESQHFCKASSHKRIKDFTLSRLPAFVRAICPSWGKHLLGLGATKSVSNLIDKREENVEAKQTDPGGNGVVVTLLIVTHSARRAVEILKSLRKLHSTECRVLKLFAKHFKVGEQVKILNGEIPVPKKHKSAKSSPQGLGFEWGSGPKIAFAVGTPNRLLKLAQIGAFNSDHLRFVLVDVAPDVKGRHVLCKGEALKDFMNFFHTHLLPRAKSAEENGTCPLQLGFI